MRLARTQILMTSACRPEMRSLNIFIDESRAEGPGLILGQTGARRAPHVS